MNLFPSFLTEQFGNVPEPLNNKTVFPLWQKNGFFAFLFPGRATSKGPLQLAQGWIFFHTKLEQFSTSKLSLSHHSQLITFIIPETWVIEIESQVKDFVSQTVGK